MSTGISMSSVNKIKELADNGDYSLALDILEHQDLSKSLSPQFIRICGEVYYENQRYADARAALVRAHSMAPIGNKIIYSIIKLYLSMGFTSLAEHYYEIYQFNQREKDAGTYRIEYMIAKAHKKPVNELYSILVTANDMETSEEWDYEMLLLQAYIRNKDKFNAGCTEFRANYRNSTHLAELDDLMSDTTDLETMIYCFPTDEAVDDDPEQNAVREFESKILAEDDQRIHPDDAKIMIMVEDDAPVTSTMKFKQMWIRSKDKKEQKKEARREEQEDPHQKKKGFGLFGRMSKKEEELVEKEIEELSENNLDKEQLLEEVISKNPDEDGTAADNEQSEEAATESRDDVQQAADMVEISGELSPEDAAVYNKDDDNVADDFESQQDNFVIEEEPEEVVMVDISEEIPDEGQESDQTDEGREEETFDDVFSDDDSDQGEFDLDVEDQDVEVVEMAEPEPVDDVEAVQANVTPESHDDVEEVFVEPEASLDDEPEVETAEVLSDVSDKDDTEQKTDSDEETQVIEAEAEQSHEEDDIVEEAEQPQEGAETFEVDREQPGGFDFDKAFESLEEFDIDEFEQEESETAESDEDVVLVDETLFEDSVEDAVEADPNKEQTEETDNVFDSELTVDSELIADSDTDNAFDSEQASDPDMDNVFDPELASDSDTDNVFDPELASDPDTVVEVSTESEDQNSMLDDSIEQAEEIQEETVHVSESQIEDDTLSSEEAHSYRRYISEKTKNADFPVFKSSLFPDYNTDGAALYDIQPDKDVNAIINEDEAKIHENLKKEEDLIGEADRLLARLGIKFNTEFKSILDFDDDDTHLEDVSIEKNDNDKDESFAKQDDGSDKKEKKSFKLKG